MSFLGSLLGKRKTKSLFIYPKFQLSLLFANALVLTLMLAGIGWMLQSSFNQLLDEGITAGLRDNHPYFKFVAYQKTLIFKSFGIGLAGALLVSSAFFLILTHRLAGPIVRLRGFFKAMREGKTQEPLRFRKNDYFSELPGEINDALATVTKKNQEHDATSERKSA